MDDLDPGLSFNTQETLQEKYPRYLKPQQGVVYL